MPISDEISYEELKALVEKSSNLFLVDVRNKDEVEKGRIPGSVHIPGEILYKITVNMRRIVTLQHVCMCYSFIHMWYIFTLYLLELLNCAQHYISFHFSYICLCFSMLYICFLYLP